MSHNFILECFQIFQSSNASYVCDYNILSKNIEMNSLMYDL